MFTASLATSSGRCNERTRILSVGVTTMADSVVERVHRALTDLALLGGGKTASLDPKVTGDHEQAVPREFSAYSALRRDLERWCEDAEKRVKDERRKVAPKPEGQSRDYWILQAEGRDYRDVAAEYGVGEDHVRRLREKADMRVGDGKPLKQKHRKAV
jgi:hypothetical protein